MSNERKKKKRERENKYKPIPTVELFSSVISERASPILPRTIYSMM